MANFKAHWKGSYINIHYRITCSSKYHILLQRSFTIIQSPTPQKAVILIKEGDPINLKESTINIRTYKGSLVSPIAAHVSRGLYTDYKT